MEVEHMKPWFLPIVVFTVLINAAPDQMFFVDGYFKEKIEDDRTSGNVSEAQFNKLISLVQAIYDEKITEKKLKPLKIIGNWESDLINAYFKEQLQINLVYVSGALARRPEMDLDSLALVVCHELGHAYGGPPQRRAPLYYASVEGQADFYGMGVCLREVFNELVPATSQIDEEEFLQKSCRSAKNIGLCIRLLSAGQSAGNLLANLKNEPQPNYRLPDSTVVRRTLKSYPKRVQCRLDTYFNAVLHRERPRCWFKG